MESLTLRAFALALVVTAAAATARSDAQQLPAGCDPQLAKAKRTGDATSYGVRGVKSKWCEGVFSQEVGNAELRLEAFTERLKPVAASVVTNLDTLIVEWNAPPQSVVHITARQGNGIVSSYYQMDVQDTTDANGRGTWKWPLTVLRAVEMYPISISTPRNGVRDPDISVQAAAHLPGTPASDSVYVPVRIVPAAGSVPASSTFEVAMTMRERVAGGKVDLRRVESDGATPAVAMLPDCPAPVGGITGGDIITVTICMPPGAQAGVYRMTVGAVSGADQIRKKSVFFYYAPPKQ
ncbi:MAG TPA: hypothetical protein VE967_11460 [Gemmatimonadaceae bacterium]|nr:hypothetical protein [Gemmatimonadaceae bacterium]